MRTDEAMKILHIEQENLTIDNVRQMFDKYYKANDPKNGGSFYLQSKIYRAKEKLELDLDPEKGKAGNADVENEESTASDGAEKNEKSSSDSSSSEDDKDQSKK